MLARARPSLRAQGKRALHDIVITGDPTRPIISQGPPGRSAVSGQVATVFGCTGFLGRYLVSRLAKGGTQVILPYRDEDLKRHLRVTGDLGQIVSLEWDLRNEDQILECVRHSDIVYNLVARDYETKNFDYASVNVDGARKIAEAAAKAGVPRLVHVSHLNASASSPSKFYATKAQGEKAVLDAFPNATIVRPGPMFGYEDRLLRSMAVWPSTWKLNQGRTKMRPVHALDVAKALANLAAMPPVARSINLPGPETFDIDYLLELVSSVTYNPPSGAPQLPKSLAKLISQISKFVWWPVLSEDQIERRFIDDSAVSGDWDVVDVNPDQLKAHALTYLQIYRSHENFSRPLILPEKPTSSGQVEYRVAQ